MLSINIPSVVMLGKFMLRDIMLSDSIPSVIKLSGVWRNVVAAFAKVHSVHSLLKKHLVTPNCAIITNVFNFLFINFTRIFWQCDLIRSGQIPTNLIPKVSNLVTEPHLGIKKIYSLPAIKVTEYLLLGIELLTFAITNIRKITCSTLG